MKWTILVPAIAAAVMVGCVSHPMSKGKRQQVELATQTGVYGYQRALGPPVGR